MRGARRWAAAGLALLVLGLLAGCRVDTTVAVTMGSDGAGAVTVMVVLDHDAASRVPDLGRLLQVADLRKAGWKVAGPTATSDGGATLTASKRFGTPAQAEAILGSLNGPSGPLRAISVSRTSGFASTHYSVHATVDLHGGVDALGDPGFVKALGGTSVATAAKALAKPGDPALAKELGFRLSVTLPGGAHGEGAARHGDTAVWNVPVGSAARTVAASSSRSHPRRLVLVAVAVVALLAAAAVVLLGRRRPRGRHARPRASRPRP